MLTGIFARSFKIEAVGRIEIFLVFVLIPFILTRNTYAQGPSEPVLNIFEANGLQGAVDQSGKQIIPPKYDELGWSDGFQDFNNGFIGYRKGQKWGLISASDEVITPPLYNSISAASSNLLIASKKGNFSGESFFGIINTKGKLVMPFMYAGLELHGEVIIAQKHDYNLRKYGLLSLDNDVILPFAYPSIYALGKNLFVLGKPDSRVMIVNKKGQEVMSHAIDSISASEEGYYHTYLGGKTGLLNNEGTTLLNPDFKKISIEGREIQMLQFNTWTFFDSNNQEVISVEFDDIQKGNKNNYITRINNKYRLSDLNKFNTDFFDKISIVSNGFYKITKKEKVGLLSDNGTIILPPIYDSLHYDSGFAYVVSSTSEPIWSLFDTLGIEKTKFEYEALRPVTEKLFPVKRHTRWGYINRVGEEVVHCVFDSVGNFRSGKSKVIFHGEQGVIDKNGDWVIFPDKQKITIINDSLYLVGKGKQTRLKSFNGDLIYFTENEIKIKPQYLEEKIDSITTWRISFSGTIFDKVESNLPDPVLFQDSLFIISAKDTKAVVASSGQILIPFGENEDILPGAGGLIGIKRDGYYGFVDFNNKLRISNRYERVKPFSNALAPVMIRGKWGFIDKNEQIIAQPLYNEVGEFKNGICPVRINKKWGMIDLAGNIVVEINFDNLQQTEKGLWLSRIDNEFGLLDPTGKTILLPRYTSVKPVEGNLIIVSRKGLYGVADHDGVMIVGFMYNQLDYDPHRDLFISVKEGKWEKL